MCAGGLATLAQLEMPVLVVVLVDGALDLIRAHQRRSGAQPFGTEFPTPDVERIGAAFGLPAVTVDSAAGLRMELARGLERRSASVIGVRIEPECYRGSF
jgi:acetolactate synthase-1/2/3 large subunit